MYGRVCLGYANTIYHFIQGLEHLRILVFTQVLGGWEGLRNNPPLPPWLILRDYVLYFILARYFFFTRLCFEEETRPLVSL